MKLALKWIVGVFLMIPLLSSSTSSRLFFDLTVLEFEPQEVALSEAHKAEVAKLFERLEECGGTGRGYRRAYFKGALEYLSTAGVSRRQIVIEVLPRGPHRLDVNRFSRESKYERFVQVRAECVVQPRIPGG
jgi:hypothetical protein